MPRKKNTDDTKTETQQVKKTPRKKEGVEAKAFESDLELSIKIRSLTERLNEARKAYETGTAIMSDREYDALYDELLEIEQRTGIILEDSPTQNVGYTVLDSLEKVPHERPMLSLDKTKEVSKLKSFLDKEEGLLSWKLDGLTVVLKYQGGLLNQALTRGNGLIGEDITHNAKHFKNLPKKIAHTGELIIRAEAVISYKEFEKINEDSQEKYKNPRNLCSGTVRQLNSEIVAKRSIDLFAFSLVKSDETFEKKSQGLLWLQGLGFQIVGYEMVTAATVEEKVLDFEQKISQNEYGSDGLVLTYDDIAYSLSLGQTSKFPRDSIAFKWRDELSETTLLEVSWNTSRTGLINPVAVFEPVELEGTTVRNASLHNLSILEELELGIGDTITVYKANMIIPQVADNLTRSNQIDIPKSCPVCGSDTEIVTNITVKSLYCSNPNCRAQLVHSLTHYCCRDACNIENLSEATIEKFVDQGFIEDFSDIYKLPDHEEAILELEGFGRRSYDRLMESIEKSKTLPLFRLIYALGIHHVGLSNAKLLCKHYSLDEIRSISVEQLVAIDGFGEVIANSIVKYFSNQENQSLLGRLLSYVEILPDKTHVQGDTSDQSQLPLKGLSFVITGTLNHFENRGLLESLIEEKGGSVSKSVSKNTSYLINNDQDSASSKNKKALSLGIQIISEDAFLEMVGAQ